MQKIRLSKFLAASGVASRRACETLIFNGKVKVNGQVECLPQAQVSDSDKIEVEGKRVERDKDKVYFLLNKPPGYLCTTTRTSEKSKLVLDLFPDVKQRIFTVGRLDKDTQGLILVTNDGHWANAVIHPSNDVRKEYLAKTDHDITDEHLKAISSGTLVEGTHVRPLKVTKVRKGTIKVVIAEGKKREVRKLLENAGLEVLELTRIRIGNLQLGSLPLGQYRALTESEREQFLNEK